MELALYATSNTSLLGRKYFESPHPFRTDFQRDIARIIHSRPFRRLEYKTQVFLNGTGDHFRTRLTHTIEVSVTARTIARTLKLNEDLTEAISLAHDLGHTPFGHTGESVLNHILKEYKLKFDHNSHSLRVIDVLIEKYPDYSGINLTWETRSGLIKHRHKNQKLDGNLLPDNLSLEAQTADLADDLTYFGHDIDDGLDSKLIRLEDLEKLSLWKKVLKILNNRNVSTKSDKFISYAIRCLIDLMVTDVITQSRHKLKRMNFKSPEEVLKSKETIIDFSPELKDETKELKNFLYTQLYNNPALSALNNKVKNVITDLFNIYVDQPNMMGVSSSKRLNKDGIFIVAADYVAGMTDRFALSEYKKYFNK